MRQKMTLPKKTPGAVAVLASRITEAARVRPEGYLDRCDAAKLPESDETFWYFTREAWQAIRDEFKASE